MIIINTNVYIDNNIGHDIDIKSDFEIVPGNPIKFYSKDKPYINKCIATFKIDVPLIKCEDIDEVYGTHECDSDEIYTAYYRPVDKSGYFDTDELTLYELKRYCDKNCIELFDYPDYSW